MMSDLASSIMRRRASIEPEEDDDDDEADGARRGGGGAGVMGLHAYLAAKDGARARKGGGSDEEWE